MAYAIVKLGGKQYRVREGERLVVDRLPHAENETFQPDVLMVGGDGKTELGGGATVTARIVEHGRGPKIRIGKYKPKSGYKKHTGFRAAVSSVLIESIAAEKTKKPAKPKAEPAPEEPTAEAVAADEPKAEAVVAEPEVAEEKPKPKRAAKPKAEAAEGAEPETAAKPAAKKPAAKKTPKKDDE